jgi:hypothetical protein
MANVVYAAVGWYEKVGEAAGVERLRDRAYCMRTRRKRKRGGKWSLPIVGWSLHESSTIASTGLVEGQFGSVITRSRYTYRRVCIEGCPRNDSPPLMIAR